MTDAEPSPSDRSLVGKLLIAAPSLVDPNFVRTVVLVADHDDEGALGLVLNRPTEVDAGAHLPDWSEALASPPVVFFGGPVQPEVAVGLVEGPPSTQTEGWLPILGPIGIYDLGRGPDPGIARARVFAGYAGWSPGQLEAEVGERDWIVVDAFPGDIFTTEPDDLWRTVLRRQRGPVRALAHVPLDLRLN